MSTKNTLSNTPENTRWRTTTPITPRIMKLGLEEARQLTTILIMNDRSCVESFDLIGQLLDSLSS